MTESTTVRVKGSVSENSDLSLRVLVIDPNPNSRHRLKDTLRGMEIVDAVSDRGSPHHLLDILSTNPVDVILIDENPGAGNVYEIVRLVKSKSVGAKLNFVLMGDGLGEEAQNKGAAAGVKAFLSRPYDIARLEAALVRAGGHTAAAAGGTGAGGGTDAMDAARDHLRDTLDKLRQVPIFKGFKDVELVRLLKICRTRNYSQGTYIFHEGDIGTSLFVLVAGKLEIRRKSEEEDRVLVRMGPGDCFGEIAIIDTEPRSADAVAATDCTVIEVNESVVNNNEDIISLKLVRQLAILLAHKLRMQSK